MLLGRNDINCICIKVGIPELKQEPIGILMATSASALKQPTPWKVAADHLKKWDVELWGHNCIFNIHPPPYEMLY